jgi:hypothetical protein
MLEALPAGHARHVELLVASGDSEYVPATQDVHAVLPDSEYFPAGHTAHVAGLLAATDADEVPAGHFWHVALLVASGVSE